MKVLLELTKEQLEIVNFAMIRYEEFIRERMPDDFSVEQLLEVIETKTAIHDYWVKRK